MPTKPNITRQPGEPLTKQNFWDALKVAYPNSIGYFCEWIEQYKVANDWDNIIQAKGWINEQGEPIKNKRDRKDSAIQSTTEKKKFYHLPLAMQIGIIIEYLESNKAFWVVIFAMDETGRVQKGVQPGIKFLPFTECLISELINYFKDEHEETAAEHRAERLKPFKDNEQFNS